MRRDAQPPPGGIYRPRNPRVSPLYQCVRRHGDELAAAGLVHRPVEAEVLERFLDCGDLHKGFARVYCDQCGHDYLLAYSCKTRYFCPGCHHKFAGSEFGHTKCAHRVRAMNGAHQKCMLAYGEWLEDNVLAPVPHRQYVFALPKLIRPFFRHRHRYLGELCRLVAALLKAGFKVMAPHDQPAFVLYVQTFGDLVTFNPHIHALVADGVFLPSGTFRVLPPTKTLCTPGRPNTLVVLSRPPNQDPASLTQMVAPKPNPATASPVIKPFLSENHLTQTEMGTT